MKSNIYKEIESIAPLLVEIGNENAYKVPDGYFEKLPNGVLGSGSGLGEVPDGYFENLTDQVIAQANDTNQAKVVSFNYKRWISMAAVFLVGMFGYMSMTMESEVGAESFMVNADVEDPFDLLDVENIYLTDLYDLVDEDVFEDLDLLDNGDEIEDYYLEDVITNLEDDELKELL